MTARPSEHGEASARVERRPGVVRLVIDRPAQGNALTLKLVDDLLAGLRAAEADASVHVLTITGSGRFFCSGGDVKGMAACSPADRPAFLRRLADAAHVLTLAMAQSRLLVLAGVNGTAAGAGLGLVLTADWVLIAEEASLLAAYANIGLTPDAGVSYWLPRVIGHQKAVDLTLGGRRLTGTEAGEWGLANECAPGADFAQRLSEAEDRFLAGAVQAIAPTKRLLRAGLTDDYEAHLRAESASISALSGHPATVRLVDRFAAR